MDNNNDGSGVNTILLVVILVIIVGGLVWFFTGSDTDQSEAGLNAEINIPSGEESE